MKREKVVCERCQKTINKNMEYASGVKRERNWEGLWVCLSCFTSHPKPPRARSTAKATETENPLNSGAESSQLPERQPSEAR